LHEQKCVLIEQQSHIRLMAHTNCTLQKNKKDRSSQADQRLVVFIQSLM